MLEAAYVESLQAFLFPEGLVGSSTRGLREGEKTA
jgi:hypothetical protein